MTNMPEVRLALILMRTLDDLKNDPGKFRNAVYSLARLKLSDELKEQDPEEAARIMSALETAIEGVEEFSGDETTFAPLLSAPKATASPDVQPPQSEDTSQATDAGFMASREYRRAMESSDRAPQEHRRWEDSEGLSDSAHRQTVDDDNASEGQGEWEALDDDVTAKNEQDHAADDRPPPNESSFSENREDEREDWNESSINDRDNWSSRESRWPTDDGDPAYAYDRRNPSDDARLPLVIIEPQPLPPLHYSTGPAYTFPPSPEPQRKWVTPTLVSLVVFLVGVCGFFIGRQMLLSQSGIALAPQTQVAQVPSPGPVAVSASANPTNGTPPNVAPAEGAASRAPATPEPEDNPDHIPLPTVYGVFALDDGKLTTLNPLVGRVPDPRVAISGAIMKPSTVTLPDGKLQFVVYRRDMATLGADHFDVRVVAKVMQKMTFDSGKVAISQEDDAWTIRNISYPFSVAPIPGKPDMLILRPQKEDFVFPPGRFGLVLNSQAYDFSVAGEITDPNQCLQRIEATNGSFYSPCQPPQANKKGDTDKKEKRAGHREQSAR